MEGVYLQGEASRQLDRVGTLQGAQLLGGLENLVVGTDRMLEQACDVSFLDQ